jgi:transposase-like protein
LVLDDGKTIGAVARDLDLTPSALRLWMRRAQRSPATDNDGHATKRPSTFFEHRRRLIQPTRKPTDLTNPSTESDQVQCIERK